MCGFFFAVLSSHYQWDEKTRQTSWSTAQGLSQWWELPGSSQAQSSLFHLYFTYQLLEGEEEGEGSNLESKALLPSFSQCSQSCPI